ncbi:MAG: AsmA family protein [Parvibaculaceae bacterium]|nr:AsmA family protein [Parvibaculaceae bacterium]
MKWRAHPWALGAVVLALLLAALILLWDWNWFRPLVEARASAALGQPVTIRHFDFEPGRTSRAVVEGLVIENPEGFGEEEPLGSAERVTVSFHLFEALRGRYVLPAIAVEEPRGNMRSNAEGERNWQLAIFEDGDGEPGTGIDIGRLDISDGRLRFADAELDADVTATFHTMERADGGEPYLVMEAEGKYRAAPFTAAFRGGSLLTLREAARPYPVDLKVANGDTHVSLEGTLTNPLRFAGANLDLTLEGKNLAELEALIGIPLVETPPYDLKGRLDYAGNRIRFTDFSGRVGQSDLGGRFEVVPGEERPYIEADLRSERVLLADLGGFIGAAPGEPAENDLSEEQRAAHAREEASPRLLPDRPFDIPDIRAADFNVHYEAGRIEGENMPLDELVATLRIENGLVTLDPLNFGVGEGRIASAVVLDARDDPIRTTATADFQNVDLRRIMEETDLFEGAGSIGGRAQIEARGNSIAEMLGQGDGDLKLFMSGGNVSALLVNLAGLDLGNAILSALGIPDRTNIRCMASDFALEQGVLQTRILYLDTEEANVIGSGSIDLGEETISYRIETEPKKASIAALPAPIIVEGRLKDPAVGPEAGELAARAAPAIALGVLLTPLAALIPTIQFGLGEDSDCAENVQALAEATGDAPEGEPKEE